jgi:hypothetical protein
VLKGTKAQRSQLWMSLVVRLENTGWWLGGKLCRRTKGSRRIKSTLDKPVARVR